MTLSNHYPDPQHCDMLDNLTTALLFLDKELAIFYANLSAETLFLMSRSQLCGRKLPELLIASPAKEGSAELISDNNIIPADDSSASDKPTLNKISTIAYKNQQVYSQRDLYIYLPTYRINRLIDYSLTPVRTTADDNNSCDDGYFIVELWQKDQHFLINKEQQAQQQHAIARQMIRNVAHEVKNPLAGIRGAAQLMSRQVDDVDAIAYLDIIIQETDRLKQLANSMLGSHQLPQFEAINVHEPVDHVINLVKNQHDGITIKRDYDFSLPNISGDRAKLIQVILNISINAVQAMQDAATPNPCLCYKTRVQYRQLIAGVLYPQVLRLDITDNGPGIPPKIKDSLFYPMVSGRAQGTGLGLSLAQDMINQHQGMIEVDSHFGRTQFTIYLPWLTPEQ